MDDQGPGDGGDIFRAEMDLVLDNNPDIAAAPGDWRDRGTYDYLYRRGQLLVGDRDIDRVLPLLGGTDAVEVVDSLFESVTLLKLRDDRDINPLLQRADDELGTGILTPNHVFSVSVKLCPATEPAVPAQATPWPEVAAVREGRGVRVAVVDTGFLETGWDKPWLAGVQADPDDLEVQDAWPSPDGYIDPYAGHGTFIAGIIRCLAPGAEVSVEQIFDHAGVVDEAALIVQLDEALQEAPDIISLSAGGRTRGNVPPKGLVDFYDNRLRHHKGVVLVAAAGNDGDRQPFWPAAFPWAVSVGSLDSSGRRRSSFSNFGGWVDVYAPGEGHVNAYATGSYRSIFDPSDVRDFRDGMCEWSGTSFSTPVVAALIAGRMARSGENGQRAAAALLEAARIQSIPGVGPRLGF